MAGMPRTFWISPANPTNSSRCNHLTVTHCRGCRAGKPHQAFRAQIFTIDVQKDRNRRKARAAALLLSDYSWIMLEEVMPSAPTPHHSSSDLIFGCRSMTLPLRSPDLFTSSQVGYGSAHALNRNRPACMGHVEQRQLY